MTKTKLAFMLILAAVTIGHAAVAENIDPTNDGSQYAWAENVGWINAEPSGNGGPGVQVTDFELTGWMWAENVGWISLSCENTSSCASVRYGVANDTYGALFGYAWAENVGWVNFRPSAAGVHIDPATGEFSGSAWGENIGWITFSSSGPFPYKLKTAWTCVQNPGPVGDSLAIVHNRTTGITTLTWNPIPLAVHYNTYRGTIPPEGMGGRLVAYDHVCFESDDSAGDGATQSTDATVPPPRQGFYYLVSGEWGCEGSIGLASGGTPRTNFDACPTPP